MRGELAVTRSVVLIAGGGDNSPFTTKFTLGEEPFPGVKAGRLRQVD
jgi:hypothetical protein